MLPEESKPPYLVAVHACSAQLPRQPLKELSAAVAPPCERWEWQHMRGMRDGIENFAVGSFSAEKPRTCSRTKGA